MNFEQSIKTCFSKYATFSGTASRSEYWWFFLFLLIAGIATSVIDRKLNLLFTLATLLPSIAAATRRLHDTNRSGWWQLVVLVPILGFVALLVFLAQKGQSSD